MITFEDLMNDPALLDKLRKESHDARVAKMRAEEVSLDDYYDRLGEIVEQHPIISAGIRRG